MHIHVYLTVLGPALLPTENEGDYKQRIKKLFKKMTQTWNWPYSASLVGTDSLIQVNQPHYSLEEILSKCSLFDSTGTSSFKGQNVFDFVILEWETFVIDLVSPLIV